jgi:hypothetical protein
VFDPNGLLDDLRKAFAERVLNAEMDHHLAGDEAGNSRNGYGLTMVTTETGRFELEVPRDRQATFDPQLIAKYQRRFPGFDDSARLRNIVGRKVDHGLGRAGEGTGDLGRIVDEQHHHGIVSNIVKAVDRAFGNVGDFHRADRMARAVELRFGPARQDHDLLVAIVRMQRDAPPGWNDRRSRRHVGAADFAVAEQFGHDAVAAIEARDRITRADPGWFQVH